MSEHCVTSSDDLIRPNFQMADDYHPDDHPDSGSGTSEDPVAAGVIETAEALPETGGMSLLALAAVPVLLAVLGGRVCSSFGVCVRADPR
jgi:hypothetical protein